MVEQLRSCKVRAGALQQTDEGRGRQASGAGAAATDAIKSEQPLNCWMGLEVMLDEYLDGPEVGKLGFRFRAFSQVAP